MDDLPRGGAGATSEHRPVCGATAVWREQALVDIAAAELLAARMRAAHVRDPDSVAPVLDRVDASLDAAREAAEGDEPNRRRRFLSAWRGASVERAWGQVDAAQEALLHIAPDDYVAGQLPRLLARARRALRPDDPRRIELESIAARDHRGLTPVDREVLGSVFHATNAEARRKQTRVRSFRNVLVVVAVVLLLAAAGLAVLGFTRPTLIPLCFNPTGHVVCPTQQSDAPVPATAPAEPSDASNQQDVDDIVAKTVSSWDIFLIEVIGMIAAAVAAAAALRGIHGTSTPYSVPVALAALKLPTGALTAVLGLMLMRGQFVPGLSALDFPAQIIAWAVIFGYAQQLFTRFVDQRAQSVLDGALPVPTPPPLEAVRPTTTPGTTSTSTSTISTTT